LAVLGNRDLMIACTSFLSCRDVRFAAAAVTITDDIQPLPRCNMCDSDDGCREAGACERPLRLVGLRGRVDERLGVEQPSIPSLLRVICIETLCKTCRVEVVCECSKAGCGCNNAGCGIHAHEFFVCQSCCKRKFCSDDCSTGCRDCYESNPNTCHMCDGACKACVGACGGFFASMRMRSAATPAMSAWFARAVLSA
jgi:hypothetical protein